MKTKNPKLMINLMAAAKVAAIKFYLKLKSVCGNIDIALWQF